MSARTVSVDTECNKDRWKIDQNLKEKKDYIPFIQPILTLKYYFLVTTIQTMKSVFIFFFILCNITKPHWSHFNFDGGKFYWEIVVYYQNDKKIMIYKFLLIIFLCKKLFKGQKKQNFTLLSSCTQKPVKYAIFALQTNLSSDKSLRFILILFFIKV